MNFFSLFRRRAERFAQLVDEANGGRRHRLRTRDDEQLSTLVELGRQVRTAGAEESGAGIDPRFRSDLRAMLMAAAEREGVGDHTPAVAPVTARPAIPAPRRTADAVAVTRRRVRARGAILIGIAAGAITVSGMSAASENAMPGDTLYQVKRSTERAQLALASSDLSRGQLFLDFARTRLGEAEVLGDDVNGLLAVLDEMDKETREGVRLLTSASVHRQDEAALDLIDLFVTGQRPTVEQLADSATGTLQGRIRTSLALIDTVADRSEDLRAAVACDAEPGRADSLGPRPGRCPATVRTAQETQPAQDAPDAPRATGEPADAPAQTGVEVRPETGTERDKPAAGRPGD